LWRPRSAIRSPYAALFRSERGQLRIEQASRCLRIGRADPELEQSGQRLPAALPGALQVTRDTQARAGAFREYCDGPWRVRTDQFRQRTTLQIRLDLQAGHRSARAQLQRCADGGPALCAIDEDL